MGFTNPVAVFFLETLISILPGTSLQKFIKKNLLTYKAGEGDDEEVSLASALAGHGNACRVLRAAIQAIKKGADLQAILDALEKPGPGEEPGLQHALASGQHYLLTSLAKACKAQNSEAIQFSFEKVGLAV